MFKLVTTILAGTLMLSAVAVPSAQAQVSGMYQDYVPGKASSGEEWPLAKKQERIQIEMIRDREQSGRTYYNTVDRVNFTVKLTNLDLKNEQKGLKAVLVLTGQNVVEKKKRLAMLRQEFDVELGIGKPAGVQEFKSKEVVTSFHARGSYQIGEKYDGWLVAICNAENEIVAYKASSESYEKNIAKIAGLEKDTWFDATLSPTEPAFGDNRRMNPVR